MRLARRVRTDLAPPQLWRALGPVKRWPSWLVYPEGQPAVARVKQAAGGVLGPGSELQVLRDDHSWTRYRVDDWAPARRLVLTAQASGAGDAPDTSPVGPTAERLIVIPQGSGAEVECLVDMGAGLRALLRRGTVDRAAWEAALDQRLEALVRVAGGAVLPDPHGSAAEAEP